MKIYSGFKLIPALTSLSLGFMLPDIWKFLFSLFC